MLSGFSVLSGYNYRDFEPLPKSKSTRYIGLEDLNYISSDIAKIWRNVPTYISICPFCDSEHKWRTTGNIPNCLECEKCHKKFRQ